MAQNNNEKVFGNQVIEDTEPPIVFEAEAIILDSASEPDSVAPPFNSADHSQQQGAYAAGGTVADDPVIIPVAPNFGNDDVLGDALDAALDAVLGDMEQADKKTADDLDAALDAVLGDMEQSDKKTAEDLDAALDVVLGSLDDQADREAKLTEDTGEALDAALDAMLSNINAAEDKEAQAERAVQDAEQKAAEAEQKVAEAASRAAEAEQKVTEAASKAAEAEQKAAEAARAAEEAKREEAERMMAQAQAIMEQARRAQDQADYAFRLNAERAEQNAQDRPQHQTYNQTDSELEAAKAMMQQARLMMQQAQEAQLQAQARQAALNNNSYAQSADAFSAKEAEKLRAELDSMRELVNKLNASLAAQTQSGQQGMAHNVPPQYFGGGYGDDNYRRLQSELDHMRREMVEKELNAREKEIERKAKEAEKEKDAVKDIRPEMVQMTYPSDLAPSPQNTIPPGMGIGGDYITLADGVFFSTKDKQIYVLTPASKAAAPQSAPKKPAVKKVVKKPAKRASAHRRGPSHGRPSRRPGGRRPTRH